MRKNHVNTQHYSAVPLPAGRGHGFLHLAGLLLLAAILHAKPAHAKPFVDNKDGTVTDQATGLIWQKGDSYHELKKGLTWYEALEYVDARNAEKFAGHNDWRLPTLNELSGIWDSSRPSSSKDGEPIGLSPEFQNGGSYYLWSADERGLDNAWYFGLGHQEKYFNLKEVADLEQGVKLVRGGKKQ